MYENRGLFETKACRKMNSITAWFVFTTVLCTSHRVIGRGLSREQYRVVELDRETKEALDRLRPKFNEVIESLKRMCDEKCNSETQAASSEKVIKCMDTCVKVEELKVLLISKNDQ
ncbi:hypothetical protein M513_03847 [Trichuris suis]|uniref:Uncharacterized protein n=1 Tax=Trichuris suis TaxID=68888 RepID=A0A085MDB0_9BILA|nr:hypothetical protein M513_03847 [Trichuris suis]